MSADLCILGTVDNCRRAAWVPAERKRVDRAARGVMVTKTVFNRRRGEGGGRWCAFRSLFCFVACCCVCPSTRPRVRFLRWRRSCEVCQREMRTFFDVSFGLVDKPLRRRSSSELRAPLTDDPAANWKTMTMRIPVQVTGTGIDEEGFWCGRVESGEPRSRLALSTYDLYVLVVIATIKAG